MSTARRSLFASTETAARIERVETELMAQCVEPVADDPRTEGNFTMAIGGGLATFGGAESPFTKVVGTGFGALPSTQEILDVERRLVGARAAVQFEISQLADPELAAGLTRRGYELVSFENVLGRTLDANDVADSVTSEHISIVRAEGRSAEWMDVVVRGSLAPDTVGLEQHQSFLTDELVRAEEAVQRAGSRIYLASLAGVVAGGAGLRITEGIAQLTGAATAPEHRRRGVQSALLHARLADAAREGCDLSIVTCQPGSISHANMQKFGFDLLYTRAILVGPPSGDG